MLKTVWDMLVARKKLVLLFAAPVFFFAGVWRTNAWITATTGLSNWSQALLVLIVILIFVDVLAIFDIAKLKKDVSDLQLGSKGSSISNASENEEINAENAERKRQLVRELPQLSKNLLRYMRERSKWEMYVAGGENLDAAMVLQQNAIVLFLGSREGRQRISITGSYQPILGLRSEWEPLLPSEDEVYASGERATSGQPEF